MIPQRALGQPFDDDSIPSRDDVRSLASQVVTEIVGDVGGFDPAWVTNPDEVAAGGVAVTLADLARWAATLGTASYVETSLFPEQNETASATGTQLYQRYKEAIDRLRVAVQAWRAKAKPTTTAGVSSMFTKPPGIPVVGLPAINGPYVEWP